MKEKEPMKPTVRIYTLLPDGDYDDDCWDIEISDFCDVLPAPGDVIVSPFVARKEDASDPRKRIMLDVVKRYFLPSPRKDWRYVCLVVKERRPTEAEWGIATKI